MLKDTLIIDFYDKEEQKVVRVKLKDLKEYLKPKKKGKKNV